MPHEAIAQGRADGRGDDELRGVEITAGWLAHKPGSALLRQGGTWVLCTCSLEERVPGWRRGAGSGWLTASYAMLPGSSSERRPRERQFAGGRTMEIERLIGRSLRGAVDLDSLPEWTLHVDCDVLQADGGTRTAAVTGGWVALVGAVRELVAAGKLSADPVVRQVAAVSVGMVDGRALLDMDYGEDVRADTDMNVVMTGDGLLLESQATAEGTPFARDEMTRMLELAGKGVIRLCATQQQALCRDGKAAGHDSSAPERWLADGTR